LGYKHIFFDLDHTLWDADTNSAETLKELYHKHALVEKGISSLDEFVDKYIEINEKFWDEYTRGNISKQALRYQRFLLTLKHFGIKNYDLSYGLTEEYTLLAPHRSALQPYVYDVLDYLGNKYALHILTNGFDEIQHYKMKASKIQNHFKHIITSDKARAKKPSSLMFEYALKLTKANANESIMIGDNLEADIIGARAAGIDQVYYNIKNIKHNERVTYEIHSLKELLEIL
jgi:putative hydrolase of the HAD superfamily